MSQQNGPRFRDDVGLNSSFPSYRDCGGWQPKLFGRLFICLFFNLRNGVVGVVAWDDGHFRKLWGAPCSGGLWGERREWGAGRHQLCRDKRHVGTWRRRGFPVGDQPGDAWRGVKASLASSLPPEPVDYLGQSWFRGKTTEFKIYPPPPPKFTSLTSQANGKRKTSRPGEVTWATWGQSWNSPLSSWPPKQESIPVPPKRPLPPTLFSLRSSHPVPVITISLFMIWHLLGVIKLVVVHPLPKSLPP